MAAKCADCGTDQVTLLPDGKVSCLVEGGSHPQLTQPDLPGEDSNLPIESYGWKTTAEHVEARNATTAVPFVNPFAPGAVVPA